MNCATRHALHTTLNRSAVLATAILLPLSWSNQANADIFGALKEATEKFVEKEIEKAVDGDTGEQQSTQALPDMAVLQVQNYLTFLGYYKGSPNGLLDSRTQNAVKSFQRDSGLPDTGLVTPELGAQLVTAFSQFSQTGQIPRNVGASSTPPSPTSPPADNKPAQQTSTTSSAAAGASATATAPAPAPAQTPEKTAAPSASSGSVADVPNRWTTVENGLVIPHPLKIDGRILSHRAIKHYAEWMGIDDPVGAEGALAEFLHLSVLSSSPEMIETKPLTFAMYLTKSERSRYLCPNYAQQMTDKAILAQAKESGRCTSHGGELVWIGKNEFETRRSRQNFIDDYRDRLIAAAPRPPFEMIDTGKAEFGQYDTASRGFVISSKWDNFVLLKSVHHQARPKPIRTQRGWEYDDRGLAFYPDFEPLFMHNRYPHAIYETWHMSTAQAEALISRLWPPNPNCNSDRYVPASQRCDYRRQVYVKFLQTQTESKPANGLPVATGGQIRVTSAVAYQDPKFEHEVYRFGLGGEGSAAGEFSTISSLVATESAPSSDPSWKNKGPMSLVEAAAGDYGLAPVDIPMIRGVPAITMDAFGTSEREENFVKLFYRERLVEQLDTMNYYQAEQLMTEEAKVQYMTKRTSCRGAPSCWFWTGTNEIEKERSRERFVKDFKPRIAAAVPRAPFDMWIILPARLDDYDFSRGGFPLDGMPTRYQDQPMSLSRNFDLPGEFLSVTPDAAEKMVESLQPYRSVYVGILFEVTSFEQFEFEGSHLVSVPESGLSLSGVLVHPRMKSMALFADEQLTQQIYRFH